MNELSSVNNISLFQENFFFLLICLKKKYILACGLFLTLQSSTNPQDFDFLYAF